MGDPRPVIYSPGNIIGPPELVKLSHNVARTLHHVCMGLSNGEIGQMFELSEDTVKSQVRRGLQALRVPTRTFAMARLYRGDAVLLVRPPNAWEIRADDAREDSS